MSIIATEGFLAPRAGSTSSIAWLYLVTEFILGAVLSAVLGILAFIKLILPISPRDITGYIVLVTGATSTLGKCMAEEFSRNNCTIVCIDRKREELKKITLELRESSTRVVRGYVCNTLDRNDVRELAARLHKEIGTIDVLVTCDGHTGQNIFDTVSKTLMSHYWAVLAFLPLLLKQEMTHIVGVTPTTSIEDAYAGSRAAIAGLMESLGNELRCRNSNLNFITIAPKADPRLLRRSEQQVARRVVQAVRRNQCTLYGNWLSAILYRISCAIDVGIATVARWFSAQGCDQPY